MSAKWKFLLYSALTVFVASVVESFNSIGFMFFAAPGGFLQHFYNLVYPTIQGETFSLILAGLSWIIIGLGLGAVIYSVKKKTYGDHVNFTVVTAILLVLIQLLLAVGLTVLFLGSTVSQINI